MLERALKLRQALDWYLLMFKNSTYLNSYDWNSLAQIFKILEIYKEALEILEAEKFVTRSLIIPVMARATRFTRTFHHQNQEL